MTQNEKNSFFREKHLLLFSPLDWGLGHTTRSLPLLRELLNLGCTIIVACNSIQKTILIKELPALQFAELPGYNVQYAGNGVLTKIKIALQLIKLLTKIKAENRWVSRFLLENPVKAVVSDNRYGFFASKVPSIFITHQLKPRSGLGAFTDNLMQKFLYRYINKFSECWVPDYEIKTGLAGELSHPEKLPGIRVKYIGAITRFDHTSVMADTPYDALIIISGPEPQRTIFEQKIILQLKHLQLNAVVIRGLPGKRTLPEKIPGIQFFNHVDAEDLNNLIIRAGYIICRSGYTSIMDLLKLKKKMIVVPTPGQPEQEYLAGHLSKNKLALVFPQDKFLLSEALVQAEKSTFNIPDYNMEMYKETLAEFVSAIK